MYYVYIIECANKALYTGITNDLKRRFGQHQTGQGGHYTSYNPAVKIRYYEEHKTRSVAAKRECQIKSWSRTKKLVLIKGGIEGFSRMRSVPRLKCSAPSLGTSQLLN